MKNRQGSDHEEALWLAFERQESEKEKRRRQMEMQWREATAKKYDAEVLATADTAWAAGFWDGEGHGSVREQRNGEFNCSVDQQDRINLERFQNALDGLGRIGPRRRRKSKTGKRQLIYTWAVTNQPDVTKLWNAIGSFLTTAKRDQFARVLAVPIVTKLQHDKPLPENVKVYEPKRRKLKGEDTEK